MSSALAKQIQRNKGNLDGVAKATLGEISKIKQGAWLLATSTDLEFPGTEGGTTSTPPMDRFGRWYIDKHFRCRNRGQKSSIGICRRPAAGPTYLFAFRTGYIPTGDHS